MAASADLQAEWDARLEREGLGVLESSAGSHVSLAAADRSGGNVWNFADPIDHLLGAVQRYPFASVIDQQVAEMLSRKVPWHRIARTLRCSKRRVSRVSFAVSAWHDPARL